MTRTVPIFATIVVVAAVAVMIGLGLWQLDRRAEKRALLDHYAAAAQVDDELDWSAQGVDESDLYRRAHLTCTAVIERSAIAGRNAADQPGVAQTATCALADGGRALVVLGWSRDPNLATGWQGGAVRGVIAPGPRLVADPPLGGLEANAIPDPSQIPNNHLSYAVQWFFFAATALVIYVIALRKRAERLN